MTDTSLEYLMIENNPEEASFDSDDIGRLLSKEIERLSTVNLSKLWRIVCPTMIL